MHFLGLKYKDVKIIFFNAFKNIYLFKIYFQNIYIYVDFETKFSKYIFGYFLYILKYIKNTFENNVLAEKFCFSTDIFLPMWFI